MIMHRRKKSARICRVAAVIATAGILTALPAGTLAYYLFADDGNGTANNTARTADYQLTITAAGIPGFGAVEVAAAVAAAFALFTLARRRRRT